jgi:hypothetical protein
MIAVGPVRIRRGAAGMAAARDAASVLAHRARRAAADR